MDQYIVYCFLGLAPEENQKCFFWPQWERCVQLLDPLFQPFAKTAAISSSQAFVVPLPPRKGDAPGTRRITLKTVPLGKLRWNLEDNRKWSQKLEEKAEHPIQLLETRIVSSKSKTAPPEVQVYVFNHDSVPGAAYNQVLTLTLAESMFRTRTADFWNDLVGKLASVTHAVRIGRTQRAWWLERQEGAFRHASSLADSRFTKRYDSLDLNDSWQTWEHLR